MVAKIHLNLKAYSGKEECEAQILDPFYFLLQHFVHDLGLMQIQKQIFECRMLMPLE